MKQRFTSSASDRRILTVPGLTLEIHLGTSSRLIHLLECDRLLAAPTGLWTWELKKHYDYVASQGENRAAGSMSFLMEPVICANRKDTELIYDIDDSQSG